MKKISAAVAAGLLFSSFGVSAAQAETVRASQAIPSAPVKVARATAPAKEKSEIVGSALFLLVAAVAATVVVVAATTGGDSNG
ncbi:hypothetical protein [Qipengyuania sphaerica]|uniref:hypothetical protein n=1 Tax=Qipengyuania sphaerica TaxID=2867243 RepID=UPI001C87B7F2|nr:hypothetical protein [Qipengyuania sphaerica]MBX7540907.1 hypothetical protein [Qipengyuania sphaerica]